jgi:hypothetical protein
MALIAWWAIDLFMTAQRLAEYSAQIALMTEVSKQLDVYFEAHREYPDSLDGFKLTYPDGGGTSTLETLRYHSTGETYSITARSAIGGKLVTGSGSKGEVRLIDR